MTDSGEGDIVSATSMAQSPIDFEALKAVCMEGRGLRMSKQGSPYTIDIMIGRCRCGDKGCTNELVAVLRTHGLFTIHWLLSKEEFLSFDSLSDFQERVIAGDIVSSHGEIMHALAEVQKAFGVPYYEVHNAACHCGACRKTGQNSDPSMNAVLTQICSVLTKRRELIKLAETHLEPSVAVALNQFFDLGYATGRYFSEFAVKKTIEPNAIFGLAQAKHQAERAMRAGKKSSEQREQRMLALMACMEALAKESPALLRQNPIHIANLAGEDASANDPKLWSQGLGQIEEYLGNIRRGEAGKDLQDRYLSLFPANKKTA